MVTPWPYLLLRAIACPVSACCLRILRSDWHLTRSVVIAPLWVPNSCVGQAVQEIHLRACQHSCHCRLLQFLSLDLDWFRWRLSHSSHTSGLLITSAVFDKHGNHLVVLDLACAWHTTLFRLIVLSCYWVFVRPWLKLADDWKVLLKGFKRLDNVFEIKVCFKWFIFSH